MGYRSSVYICIPEKDLYILQGDSFLDYCDIKELENNLLLIHGEDINLYHTTWDSFINLIENCSMYHWISIGEDGAIHEFSNTSLLEVEHIIHTPTQLGDYSKEGESNLVKQIFLILKLILPKEYTIYDKDICINCKSLSILATVYTCNNLSYIRFIKNNSLTFKTLFNLMNKSFKLLPVLSKDDIEIYYINTIDTKE